MGNPKREVLKVRQKRAILAAVLDRTNRIDKERALDEMRGLAKTARVHVVDTLVQVREAPDPATCLGRGKVDELNELIDRHEADLVIFDNNLTPAQGRNLENATETVIVDRSEVILDIFAATAQTYEARLQVELAQLLYFRPRLKRLWTHLERIEGGVGAGRGPGEKQLETDRRLIDKRVAELQRKLKDVEKRRRLMVAKRRDQFTVSLVGYTNAGKSTLLNALTDADVLVADKLFATLDTRTRRWHLPNWGEVLLSDTVGFIRDLPHHLVASFRSTLEEARHADLLLHVVDASSPYAQQQIDTVNSVLDEIGVNHDNTLLVFNKADVCSNRSFIDVLRARHEGALSVSARTGERLDLLAATVAERLAQGYVIARIEMDVSNGRLLSYLAEHTQVVDRSYHDGARVTVSCRIPRARVAQLRAQANGDHAVITVDGMPSGNDHAAELPVSARIV